MCANCTVSPKPSTHSGPDFSPRSWTGVAALEPAATASAAHELSIARQEAAHSAAHKLAGVLPIFALADETFPARELETMPGIARRSPVPSNRRSCH